MRRPISLVLVSLAVACTHTAPETAPELKQAFIRAKPDEVFDRAVAIFANFSIPIQTMDRSSGLIVSQPLTVSGDERAQYLNCSHGLVEGNFRRATMTFNVFIRAAGDSGSAVRINTAAIGYQSFGQYGTGTQPCNSNGQFEQRVLTKLKYPVG